MSDIKDLLFNQDPEIVNTGLDQLTFFFEEELAREVLGETTHQVHDGFLQFQFAGPMLEVPSEARFKVALFLFANLNDDAFQQHTKIILDEWSVNPCPSFSMSHLMSLTWRINMAEGEIAIAEDLIWDLELLETIEVQETNVYSGHMLEDHHPVQNSISGGLSRIPYVDAEKLTELNMAPSWSFEGLEEYEGITKSRLGLMLETDAVAHEGFEGRDIEEEIARFNQFCSQNNLTELTITRMPDCFDQLQLPPTLKKLHLSGLGTSLSFLKHVPELEELSLCSLPSMSDVSEILNLTSLQKITIHFDYNHSLPFRQEILGPNANSSLEFDTPEKIQQLCTNLKLIRASEAGAPCLLPHPSSEEPNKIYVGGLNIAQIANVELESIHEKAEEIHICGLLDLEKISLPTMRNVKVVNIFNAHNLADFEFLSAFPNLEELRLRQTSIRTLKNIPVLSKLHTLDVSHSHSLHHINFLQDFDGIESFPNLQYCNASSTNIQHAFHLHHAKILKELHIQRTSINNLSGLEGLSALQRIYLSHIHTLQNLEGLPSVELEVLDIEGCSELSSLQGLPVLNMTSWSIRYCPKLRDIRALRSSIKLETLCTEYCPMIDDWFPLANLPNLTQVQLGVQPYSGQTEGETIEGRDALQQFFEKNQDRADLFAQIPAVRKSLDKYRLEEIMPVWPSIASVQDMFYYRKLVEGTSINEDGKFETWEGHYSSITDFILFHLYAWAEHPDFVNANHLRMYSANGIENLDLLEKAPNLESFAISSNTLTDISGLRYLEKFTDPSSGNHNNTLYIQNASKLEDFSPLQGLRVQFLYLYNLPHLKSIDFNLFSEWNMWSTRPLFQLHLSGSGIQSLKGLEEQTVLHTLELKNCTFLTSLEGLSPSIGNKLDKVDLRGCSSLTSLSGLEGIGSSDEFEHLLLKECSGLTDISALSESALTSIDFQGCSSLSDISPLGQNTNLSELKFRSCPAIEDISAFAGHPSLKKIEAWTRDCALDLSSLEKIPSLEEIVLASTKENFDFGLLREHKHLRRLIINSPKQVGHEHLAVFTGVTDLGVEGLNDAKYIPKGEALTSLWIWDCTVSSLSFLEEIPNIQLLNLEGANNITDFSAIFNAKQLQSLHLPEKSKVLASLTKHDLNSKEEIRNALFMIQLLYNIEKGLDIAEDTIVADLDLSGNAHVSNLSFVHQFPNLETLVLRRCPNLTTLDGLAYHPSLTSVQVQGCSQLTDVSALATLAKMSVTTLDLTGTGLVDIQDLRGVMSVKEEIEVPLPSKEVMKWLSLARLATYDLRKSSYGRNRCTDLTLDDCKDVQNLNLLFDSKLESLRVNGCINIESMDSLYGCRETLKVLSARHVRFDLNFTGFSTLTNVNIRGNTLFKQYDTLSSLSEVNTLALGDSEHLTHLNFIHGLHKLQKLGITRPSTIQDWSGLSAFHQNTRDFGDFHFGDSDLMLGFYHDDITELPDLPVNDGIHDLQIIGLRKLTSLEKLQRLSGVKTIWLGNLDALTDISALLALPQLVKLDLKNMWGQTSSITGRQNIVEFVSDRMANQCQLIEYDVLLHNNDVTPMNEVVDLLTTIFQCSGEYADELMRTIHHSEKGVVGSYTFTRGERLKEKCREFQQQRSSVLRIEFKEVEHDFETLKNEVVRCIELLLWEDACRLVSKAMLLAQSDEDIKLMGDLTNQVVSGTKDPACWSASLSIFEQCWNLYTERFGAGKQLVEKKVDPLYLCASTICKMSDVEREWLLNKVNETIHSMEETNESKESWSIDLFEMRRLKSILLSYLFRLPEALELQLDLIEEAKIHQPSDTLQHMLDLAWVYLDMNDERCMELFEASKSLAFQFQGWFRQWPECGQMLYESLQSHSFDALELQYRTFAQEGIMSFWRLRVFRMRIDRVKSMIAVEE